MRVFSFIIVALGAVGAFIGLKQYGGAYGMVYGLGISLAVAVPVALIIAFVMEKLGDTANKLYMGTGGMETAREQLRARLNAIRIQKRLGKNDEALKAVNAVLDETPRFGEAMLLKAQILAEGFNNTREAFACCEKALSMQRKGDPVYQWASNYHDELMNKVRWS